jgi:electron transport complex protein RnfA
MTDTNSILMSAILINNILLVQLFGVSAFAKIANRPSTAVAMAIATTAVVTLSAAVNHLVDTWILVPLQLGYLRTLTSILVIATLAQCGALLIEAQRPALYRELGGLLPCLASNTLILAVALQNSLNTLTFSQSVRSGLGAGLGFSLVLILFCATCERLTAADVPRPFRGAAITMISAGLMSMAFMGLSGLA